MKQALEAIEELQSKVDTLIVISNDKLLQIVPDNTPVSNLSLFSRFQKFHVSFIVHTKGYRCVFGCG